MYALHNQKQQTNNKQIKTNPLLKKTNNQTRQIICLSVVSRYNFHYLKKGFIKSFSR